MDAVLKAAGSNANRVVKTTVSFNSCFFSKKKKQSVNRLYITNLQGIFEEYVRFYCDECDLRRILLKE